MKIAKRFDLSVDDQECTRIETHAVLESTVNDKITAPQDSLRTVFVLSGHTRV